MFYNIYYIIWRELENSLLSYYEAFRAMRKEN